MNREEIIAELQAEIGRVKEDYYGKSLNTKKVVENLTYKWRLQKTHIEWEIDTLGNGMAAVGKRILAMTPEQKQELSKYSTDMFRILCETRQLNALLDVIEIKEKQKMEREP